MQYPQRSYTILSSLLLIGASIAKPLVHPHNFYSAATKAETRDQSQVQSFSHDSFQQTHEQLSSDTGQLTALSTYKRGFEPIVQCKILKRHQQAVVLPTLIGVTMLQNFWLKIALDATSKFSSLEPAKALFTITQGNLQATFSCLGIGVPWDFVHEISMNAWKSVSNGWLDTFDAIYEQSITGYQVWVSLRVLGQPQGGLKRARPG